MALVSKCQKCGIEAVIDTHCGYCFGCLDGRHPDLQHKPTCQVAIRKARGRAREIILWHDTLSDAINKQKRISELMSAISNILIRIDPCPICGGKIEKCATCDNRGFVTLNDERRQELLQLVAVPDPEPTT